MRQKPEIPAETRSKIPKPHPQIARLCQIPIGVAKTMGYAEVSIEISYSFFYFLHINTRIYQPFLKVSNLKLIYPRLINLIAFIVGRGDILQCAFYLGAVLDNQL